MVIRNIKKDKASPKKLVLITVLIVVVILAVVKIFNMPHEEEDLLQNIPDLPAYAEGEAVEASGTLEMKNNFPHYTHLLHSPNGHIFGLKSTALNLNDYSGSVEVEGTIDTLIKSLPVISINTLKVFNENLVIKNNSYLFVDDLIYFDFGDQVGFQAVKSGNNIRIYFQDLQILDIDRFSCNQVTESQNCDHILTNLKNESTEMFSSHLNYDFYRYGSGKWISFNQGTYGYVFSPINEDTMLDISSIIYILDSKFVMKKKQNTITEECQNDTEKLNNQKISDIHVTHDDPKKITLILKGETDQGNQSTCSLVLNLWDNRLVEQVLFAVE